LHIKTNKTMTKEEIEILATENADSYADEQSPAWFSRFYAFIHGYQKSQDLSFEVIGRIRGTNKLLSADIGRALSKIGDLEREIIELKKL
jgi:hypothetical protein